MVSSSWFPKLVCFISHNVHLIILSSKIALFSSTTRLWKYCFSSFFKVNFWPESILMYRWPLIDFSVRVSFFRFLSPAIASWSKISQSSLNFRFWLWIDFSLNRFWFFFFKRCHFNDHLAWSVWGQKIHFFNLYFHLVFKTYLFTIPSNSWVFDVMFTLFLSLIFR